jgi:hypothetical protein
MSEAAMATARAKTNGVPEMIAAIRMDVAL